MPSLAVSEWTHHFYTYMWDPPVVHLHAGPTTCPLTRGTHHLSIYMRDPPLVHLHMGPTSSARTDKRPHPCPSARRRPLLPLSPIFLFSSELSKMSSSSTTHSKWLQYGPVPLTRYPDCPCPERKTDDNGNLGHKFVGRNT